VISRHFSIGTKKKQKKLLSIALSGQRYEPGTEKCAAEVQTLDGSAECRMWVADRSG